VLNEELAKSLINKILKLSPARATEILLKYQNIALTRFANNSIIQNVAEDNLNVAIRVLHQDKMGRAETNRTDAEPLVGCCERALQLAKFSAPDPNCLPLPGRQSYETTSSFFEPTHSFNAAQRAEQVHEMIRLGKEKEANLAGIHKIETTSLAIGNSQGLFALSNATHATISVTAAIREKTGGNIINEPDIEKISPSSLVKIAIQKALFSQKTIDLPSGEYTVILEPLAVLNLLSSLIIDYISQVSPFSGTAFQSRLGFASGNIGKKIFGENFILDDDAYHPLHQGTPFDGEGMPRMPVILVYNGIIAHLVHSRASALQMGEEPTGHALELPNPYGAVPQHIVMRGGKSTIEEMVKKTKKGLYVSRFWYNRIVEPAYLALTGMTRDGTFLIEDGKIICGVKNMRFNESLFNVFRRITDLGSEVRTYDNENGQVMVVPPIRVEGFRFSGPTKV